jgi:AraC family transcriptional regulator
VKTKQSVTLAPSMLYGSGVSSGIDDDLYFRTEPETLGSPSTFLTKTLTAARQRLRGARPVIPMETTWRQPAGRADRTGAPRVMVSRWRSFADETRQVEAKTDDDGHLVKILLRTMNFSLHINGKCVHDGVGMPGMVHVTEPGASARCLFRGAFDTLHLHVSNALIDECLPDVVNRPRPLLTIRSGLTSDATIERLARSLLAAEQHRGSLGPLYTDCIGVAILTLLLSAAQTDGGAGGPSSSGLVKWRLRRTIEYIETHLGEPIRLADMAGAAGLTRIHFATCFKAATGLRPHEYLLRRRIERGQEMLLVAGISVVDIALSVGFQSQSHFTTTFARFVGQTPHAWRLSHGVK